VLPVLNVVGEILAIAVADRIYVHNMGSLKPVGSLMDALCHVADRNHSSSLTDLYLLTGALPRDRLTVDVNH